MKKRCEKVSCAMYGKAVTTEAIMCLSCGSELKPAERNPLAGMFGDAGGLFGGEPKPITEQFTALVQMKLGNGYRAMINAQDVDQIAQAVANSIAHEGAIIRCKKGRIVAIDPSKVNLKFGSS